MQTFGLNDFAYAAAPGPTSRADGIVLAPASLQLLLKALIDRASATLLLLLLLPVLLAVALLVAVDSRGPVLFRQVRVGLNDRLFTIWKFRTMHHELRDTDARPQTGRCDRRVTRLGRLLRRLSLDELPQLFNVLRGDMSLVGPRPIRGEVCDGRLPRPAHPVEAFACREGGRERARKSAALARELLGQPVVRVDRAKCRDQGRGVDRHRPVVRRVVEEVAGDRREVAVERQPHGVAVAIDHRLPELPPTRSLVETKS